MLLSIQAVLETLTLGQSSVVVAPIALSSCSIILHSPTWPLGMIVHCSLWKGATKLQCQCLYKLEIFSTSNNPCKWPFAICEIVYKATAKFVCFTKFAQCLDAITLSIMYIFKKVQVNVYDFKQELSDHRVENH